MTVVGRISRPAKARRARSDRERLGVRRRVGKANVASGPESSLRELVEVGLQMLRADTIVDAAEPGLQVAEDEVDDRQELFGDLGIAAFGDGMVIEASYESPGLKGIVIPESVR